MINENILINRRKWIIEKIDEYLRGKITRKELQEWAFQQREWEPNLKAHIDNNPNDVSNVLDLLCYILNEPIEIGITDEELIEQKEYLEKIEKIFRREILPRIDVLEGYYVKEKNEHMIFLILYSKDNQRFLETIIYEDSKVIRMDQKSLEKRKAKSKLPFYELEDKYEEFNKGIINKESYIKFVLEILENENMKEWYSGILDFLGYIDDEKE